MHKISSLNLLIITKQTPICSVSTILVKNRAETSVHAHSRTFCLYQLWFSLFLHNNRNMAERLETPPTKACLISSVVKEMQNKTILTLMSLQIGII